MISKREILQIIADQQDLGFSSNDLPRLTSNFSDNDITVISGVRRCGKSTLLNEIRSKREEKDYYFNFDDDRLIHFEVDDFQTLYEVFLHQFGKQITFYFDEIQNIKGWERFVRRLNDYNNKVFITGSNASMLSRELGTHLTGRYDHQELFPFSFSEFLAFKNIAVPQKSFFNTGEKVEMHRNFLSYFQNGGFPAFLRTGKKQYLKTLFESIIYRDVMVRNSITNEKEILELIHFLASNTSKLITYNSLTKIIGVKNATTVKNYLGFLENSYLLFAVNKFDYSLKKQILSPKKIYLIDLALTREIGFHSSEDNGRLLENLVYIELKRRGKQVYYHSQKHECDFVMKEKNRIMEAIQVSWSVYDQTTRERELTGLLDALNTYDLQ
ncbi:MAG: ATP-binding protein, partial [Bacteroidota bacterium]